MSLDARVNQPTNQQHYDSIADAWQYLLGTNFHWGYFQTERDSLDDATDRLIELLVEPIKNQANLRLLDVGCGIGGPAEFLAKKYGWKITGFSTSTEGIARARKRAKESQAAQLLSFDVRDALDNGYPDSSFDAVILLEMSHLVHDKASLIAESVRTLKVGGTIALCDLTIQRRLVAREIVEQIDDIQLLERSFGKARLETLSHYEELFKSAGLKDLQLTDISRNVAPTIASWRENVQKHSRLLSQYVSDGELVNFEQSCDVLERLYKSGLWGYGLITGKKAGGTSGSNITHVKQTLY